MKSINALLCLGAVIIGSVYPFNREWIAEYMAWEKANAATQIEDVERLIKERKGRAEKSIKAALIL